MQQKLSKKHFHAEYQAKKGSKMTYFTHPKIFTGEANKPFASVMGIDENGAIAYLADSLPEGVSAVQALPGAMVLPALIDSHTHPDYVAANLDRLITLPPLIKSIEDIVQGLKQHKNFERKDLKTGEWIWLEGFGYDEAVLKERRSPTCEDLDRVSLQQPVVCYHSSGHIIACNSAALRLAGIDKNSKDPAGGQIGRFANGEPNGILYEPAAQNLLTDRAPKPDIEVLAAQMAKLGKHYARLGVCELSDLYCMDKSYCRYDMYKRAAQLGFAQGISLYYLFEDLLERNVKSIPDSQKRGQVRIAGVKMFIDGSIAGKTAYMLHNYPNEEHRGMKVIDEANLAKAVDFCRANNVQLAIHTMGDASVLFLVEQLEKLEPWPCGEAGDAPCIRIEHASLISDALLERMQKASMSFALAPQVLFLYAEYAAYRAALNDELLARAYAAKSYDNYLLTSLSSDAPATLWADPENLFHSLQASVTRIGASGEDMNKNEALDPKRAWEMHSLQGALICGREKLGALRMGYRGNFIAVDRDIFDLSLAHELGQSKVLATYIGGKSQL